MNPLLFIAVHESILSLLSLNQEQQVFNWPLMAANEWNQTKLKSFDFHSYFRCLKMCWSTFYLRICLLIGGIRVVQSNETCTVVSSAIWRAFECTHYDSIETSIKINNEVRFSESSYPTIIFYLSFFRLSNQSIILSI